MLRIAVGGRFAKLGYNRMRKLLRNHINAVVIVAEFREITLGLKIGYIAVFVPYRRNAGVFDCRK